MSGVLGSGREDLNALIFGAQRRAGGEITMAGDRLPPGDMVTAIERGAAFVPADRHRHGAVMTMSMRENLTLPALRGLPRRFGAIRMSAEAAEARRWARQVDLRPAGPGPPAVHLQRREPAEGRAREVAAHQPPAAAPR